MVYQVDHYINGKREPGSDNTFHDIYNPATGELQGTVHYAHASDVDKAIHAAKEAFPTWSQTTLLKRSQILFRYKTLLENNIQELAKLITQEHGKTLSDAMGSIQRGIAVVEFACGIANHLKGEITLDAGTGIDVYSIRQPLGICVGITPFNFPAMIPLWMFSVAIACGNTFILKPSEQDPSCSLRLAELMTDAGLPNGVLNVLQGDKEVVNSLIHHPDVKAISFVGSTQVAQYVYETGIKEGKRVQAFGGAKNHCVVMPDADMGLTADAIMGAAYGSAGQRCMAISVVVAVGDATANHLIQELEPKIKSLKIGSGMDEQVEMGPLVTQKHLQKVRSYIDLGVSEGAKLIVDGRDIQGDQKGNYLGGSLFDRVTKNMRLYREEIFGPVLSIVRVSDFSEAVKLVNEHEYGNGTAIFTNDANVARSFAKNAQIGMIGINVPIPVPVAQYSFGGWKKSFFGDIHMHGAEGVQFYTKLKTITSRWPEKTKSKPEYKMPTVD